ncbi:nuclear transport factor 2 family protein [Arthrobacter alpinus]|uniref:nuclear transport factor 2 family protein n=1 Tax=Arthrobacter alpinus TaxID=656366 RepID=UPI0023B7AC2C|nr:nuclear transport factor 2 family protein [Arthrobacter alpinus]
MDTLMSVVTEDVTAVSPVGPIEGAQAFRAFWANFGRMFSRIDLVGAYGDD